MFCKKTVTLVVLLLMALFVTPAMAATGSTILDKLADVETAIFGATQNGALVPRVENLERVLDGAPAAPGSALIVRINTLSDRVTLGSLSGGSLLMKLNAAEWIIFRTQTSSEPILNRLKKIEEQLLGEASTNSGLVARIDSLLQLVWPGGVLNIVPHQLALNQKVKVKLLTEVSSVTSREGDKVQYQVAEDVIVDNKIIIARDTKSVGTVGSVKKAGPFGQSGQINIDFGRIAAIDGSLVPVMVQASGSTKAGQQEIAAGASLGGMVLLGPVGLAAGYLVQGKAETIPVGTQVELIVSESLTVQALSQLPSK